MGSPSSFANVKDLMFVMTLGASAPAQPFNTITLQGLRATAYVDNAGGTMMGTLHAQIYGMSASDMNSLTSTMWDLLAISAPNSIQVFAIDGSQKTLVYNGIMLNAWGVYDAMPEVFLLIEGQVAYAQQLQSATPTSLAADTNVAVLMQSLAKSMGFTFENNGVEITVPKGTYLGNTLMEQAKTLMQMYKFWMYLDSSVPNTLAIAPYGSPRSVELTPLISPETGLIGYPKFNSTGVNFETLFNPGIVYGGPVQLKSSIPKAKGIWTVTSMSHDLSSQVPGGPWKTTVNAVSPSLAGSLELP